MVRDKHIRVKMAPTSVLEWLDFMKNLSADFFVCRTYTYRNKLTNYHILSEIIIFFFKQIVLAVSVNNWFRPSRNAKTETGRNVVACKAATDPGRKWDQQTIGIAFLHGHHVQQSAVWLPFPTDSEAWKRHPPQENFWHNSSMCSTFVLAWRSWFALFVPVAKVLHVFTIHGHGTSLV